jgi:D-beta-D-heptose 7-phosphate kinase/D-beta-D-heptose 1-phosphate adenosyltransferase
MCPHSLAHALDGLGKPRLLVVGDLMLDRYTWGDAQRISQEAPVIVLRADQSESRPGGAANVANMLLALEGDVTCVGVVGQDQAGNELREMLHAAGAHVEGIIADNARPTSVKQRFVGRADTRHESQILRVDHESCAEVDSAIEAQLIAHIEEQVPWHDALLISDYGKGVCTERLLRMAIDAANLCQIPVIVDPSPTCELDRYHGVTIIKPNRREAETVTGLRIAQPNDALEAGKQLCRRLDAKMALLTLDRDGMLLVEQSGQGDIYPTQARSVYDITGAGDMVMATVGLCLAAGTTPEDAVRLANITAGMEVERTGVAVIHRDEIRGKLASMAYGSAAKIVARDQAARIAAELRRRGESVVFTNGCFDLLHVGHVSYLAEAAKLGSMLIVGVNSDASVRRLKGTSRPVISETDRAAMLAALGCVGYVVVFDEDTPHRLLEAIRPDVLVKGGTYRPDEVVGHELVESYGGRVCVTNMVDGVSTSKILESLRGGSKPPLEQTPFSSPNPTSRPLRRAG